MFSITFQVSEAPFREANPGPRGVAFSTPVDDPPRLAKVAIVCPPHKPRVGVGGRDFGRQERAGIRPRDGGGGPRSGSRRFAPGTAQTGRPTLRRTPLDPPHHPSRLAWVANLVTVYATGGFSKVPSATYFRLADRQGMGQGKISKFPAGRIRFYNSRPWEMDREARRGGSKTSVSPATPDTRLHLSTPEISKTRVEAIIPRPSSRTFYSRCRTRTLSEGTITRTAFCTTAIPREA